MTMMPVFENQYGSTVLKFNTSKMTGEMIDKMKIEIAKVRGNRSIYSRLPMNCGETNQDYLERASAEDPEIVRKEDESVEEHTQRIYTPKVDSLELGFLFLNALAPLFDQPTIAREDYDKAQLLKTKDFVFNILNFADIPAGEFSPKSVVGGNKSK